MQSHSFWHAVAMATDMFESEPVEGSFDEWMSNIWPDFETMCVQVAKHHYVMQMAHRQWRQETQATAALLSKTGSMVPVEFIDTIECVRLKNLCTQVGLEPNEFVEHALHRHKIKCLK